MSKLIIAGGSLIAANSKLLGIRSYLSEELRVDQIPQAGFSLRRINKSYTGPIIEVYDPATDTATDIYTNKETISKEYLLSLVDGNGDLFVRKWYDQYNAGYYIDFSVSSNLPKIISTGSFYLYGNNPRSFGLYLGECDNYFDYYFQNMLTLAIYKVYLAISQLNRNSALIRFPEFRGEPYFLIQQGNDVKFNDDTSTLASFTPPSDALLFTLNVNLDRGDTKIDIYTAATVTPDLSTAATDFKLFRLNPYLDSTAFQSILHEIIVAEEANISASSNNVFKNQDNYFFKE